jgi:hypothetical protein
VESEMKNKIVMLQAHLINQLIQKFDNQTSGKRNRKKTGIRRFKVQSPTKEMKFLDPNSQKKYRSGVGMFLCMTKYLRPDIRNVLRRDIFLSEFMVQHGVLTMRYCVLSNL